MDHDESRAHGGWNDSDDRMFLHDLRQLVAVGRLMSSFPGDDGLEPEVRDRLEAMGDQFRLISDLIASQTEEAPDRPWVVDVVKLVDECVNAVRLTGEVSVVSELSAPAVTFGDPLLLRRALTNILDNASRAAGRGGSVAVSVGAGHGETLIEVTDSGPGFGAIPPGTGHGMRVVDAALRQMRGRLEIRSAPEQGTLVRLRLPAQRGEGLPR